jgi:hypothetical protein
MTDPKQPANPSGAPAPRRPYERPSVISEEVFETLALSCANARLACPPTNLNKS